MKGKKSKTTKQKKLNEQKESPKMEVINPRACGIDVGSVQDYVACPPKDGKPNVRAFNTDTESLNELADWLISEGVETVAMESTGVYWIALYELLDRRGLKPVLVDARSIGRVPGRKTDMLDCQWLQQLHTYGMLHACFRPEDDILGLRSSLRLYRSFKHQQDDYIRRMQKALDEMNVRIHRSVSDVTGVTGMRMLRAIVNGERDPQVLAMMRDPRCRKDVDQMVRELTGNWRAEHLFELSMSLKTYDHFAEQIKETENRILAELDSIEKKRALEAKSTMSPEEVKPHPNENKQSSLNLRGGQKIRTALAMAFGVDLTLIEGIGADIAAAIMGEIGPDVKNAFPSEKAFVAYLGFAPNMAISGGKALRKRKRAHRGTHVLHQLLRTAASTVQRSQTALGAYYRKIAYRKGAGVAVFATGRKICQHIYRALALGVEYVAQGVEEENERAQARTRKRLEKQAAAMGLKLVAVAQ